MPWHIICYLETACLFSPIFFSFISNHFQFNHVYILILPLYALQIPIIILLEKRYEVHVLYIDKKIETCGNSFFQMIYKWGIRGQNRLIEVKKMTTIFYSLPQIISDSFRISCSQQGYQLNPISLFFYQRPYTNIFFEFKKIASWISYSLDSWAL